MFKLVLSDPYNGDLYAWKDHFDIETGLLIKIYYFPD